MIEPMKHVTVLILEEEREAALEKLRELGAMHLVSGDGAVRSQASEELTRRKLELEKVISALEKCAVVKFQPDAGDGRNVFDSALALIGEHEQIKHANEGLNREISMLTVWGNFDFSSIEKLASQGIYVTLCRDVASNYRKLAASRSDTVEEIGLEPGGFCDFVVISTTKPAPGELPEVAFKSDRSLAVLRRSLAENTARLEELQGLLDELAGHLEAVRSYQAEVGEMLDFANASDALSAHGPVLSLEGFIPASRMSEFGATAKRSAWGYLAVKADPAKEVVPTLLRMPRWVGIIRPLLDFLSIRPGYDEFDVSWAFLGFFTIFFGMLVGDAGYGTLFLIGSVWMMRKYANKPKGLLAAKLFFYLSLSAVAWGVLTSNYFGMSGPVICPALSTAADKDRNVQLICFSLGMAQLTLAHLWRMVADSRWRNLAAQTGWIFFLAGNSQVIASLLLNMGSCPVAMGICYGVGFVLLLAGEVEWGDAGSMLGFPFSLVSSFVDMLSYIRLFAVGMAGYYLASCFNAMAGQVAHSIPVLGLVFAGLVLLLGHSLNIALAMMSVLVHGVRLNTLEFSSHANLRWAGIPFKPFQRNNGKQTQE
ncbi:MAG: hypothetical protein PHS41_02620 [Victivallaceae bacterium]|nr:hypothetical protein [Victivallaceae bacterium]